MFRFHPPCTRFPVVHFHKHFVVTSVFKILAVLVVICCYGDFSVVVWWYLMVVLICIYLVMKELSQLFIYVHIFY